MISATTRDPRPGEHEGRDYHFVDRAEFDRLLGEGEFLEWAEVYGQRYGSPKSPILASLDRGDSVLFDIDFQGAMSISDFAPADAVKVYILPPTLAEMRRRLHARSQDSEAVIAKRMRQRGRILDRIRGCKVTTPYKAIARLLGAPVGTVCSRIFRLRQRLEALAPGGVGREEAVR